MTRFDEIDDNRYDAIMNAAVCIGEDVSDIIMARTRGEGWSDLERNALAKETLTIIKNFFRV